MRASRTLSHPTTAPYLDDNNAALASALQLGLVAPQDLAWDALRSELHQPQASCRHALLCQRRPKRSAVSSKAVHNSHARQQVTGFRKSACVSRSRAG